MLRGRMQILKSVEGNSMQSKITYILVTILRSDDPVFKNVVFVTSNLTEKRSFPDEFEISKRADKMVDINQMIFKKI